MLLYPVGDVGARTAFFDELPARRKVDAVVLVGLAVDDREAGRPERLGVGIVAAGDGVAGHPARIEGDLVETRAGDGAGAMSTLLGRPSPPTAVLAHCDEIALGAIRTVRRAGLRVPEDVSVIGIDDHPLAALTDLSTVARPLREQGGAAGRIVVAALRGEVHERSVVLPTRQVIRGSTAPPRTRRRARPSGS